MCFPLPKRLFCWFNLIFSFVGLTVFYQSVWANEQAKDIQEIVKQEILQFENPSTFVKTLNQIIIEKNPAQQLKLISPLFQINTKNILTKEKQPQLWAMFHKIAADAFFDLNDIHGATNLEQEIRHNKLALQVYNLEVFPKQWAKIQYNLAIAYNIRTTGERANNLEQTIKHHQLVLQVRTREAYPKQWAKSQHNLAIAHYLRILGERAENLEKAIKHNNMALQVLIPKMSPKLWAATQTNLGAVYIERIRGERSENLELAIKHIEAALKIITRKASPEKWAGLQSNLAAVYSFRILGDQTGNLEEAIKYSEWALEVISPETFPKQWADIQINLAIALYLRIGGKRTDNLEKSIKHNKQALEVITQEAFPEDWAKILSNLAVVYVYRIEGEEENNLEKAIKYNKQALQVYTKKEYPEDWAGIQANLAGAFIYRIHGERSDNLEKAIKHDTQALQVYSQETYPQDWARVQNNLAVAYNYRTHGDKINNLEQAIKHNKRALQVTNHKAFPEEFVQTVINLSTVLLETQQYQSALSHLIVALKTNEAQLQQTSFIFEERRRLVEQAQELFTNAIWATVQMKDYTQAMRLLEWSKARLLRQNLALDKVNLQNIPIKRGNKIRELQAEVSSLEIQLHRQMNKLDPELQVSLTSKLKNKRQQLREILKANGVNATLIPNDAVINQWLSSLPQDSTLIAPIFSDFGTIVFVFSAIPHQIRKLHVLVLSEFSRKDLHTITRGENGYLQTYRNWTYENNTAIRQEKRIAWQNQLSAGLDTFRDGVINPVLEDIRELGVQSGTRLLWLSDDDSSLLPIHATMIGSQPLLSLYTVQFVPSLYTAYTTQQRLTSNSNNIGEHLMGLFNPNENLDYASIEAILISRFFKSRTVLLGSDGTTAKLNQALTDNPTYLHFSTHGSYKWQNPLESGLELAQGDRLTLGELLSKPNILIDSRLAVLSACETGLTDINTLAEAFGLPTAFLQAGVPGVISTLWTVNELSTAFLFNKFYELHLKQDIEPPKALAQAQEWLRTRTYQELLGTTIYQSLHKWLITHIEEKNSSQFLRMTKVLHSFRINVKQHANNRPYQEQYYWAGFVFSGM